MITLYLLHPVHKTPVQNWAFEQVPIIRIGRSADNDVVLYSAVVSRYHVEIQRTQAGWHLKNLGTNGTYLEGKRITELPVQDGLVIRLARSGPIIQIHTDKEEVADPLQRILSHRPAAESKLTAETEPVTRPTHMEPPLQEDPTGPQGTDTVPALPRERG